MNIYAAFHMKTTNKEISLIIKIINKEKVKVQKYSRVKIPWKFLTEFCTDQHPKYTESVRC